MVVQPPGYTEIRIMPDRAKPSRRDFLAAGVGLLVAGGLSHARAVDTAPPRSASASKGRAKNVIFMVADGMSIGTFSVADLAVQHRTGRGLAWASLWDHPDARRSMMSTRSANSLVTDSAAAGSSWGCGKRINNGEICWHGGHEIEPILVTAKRAGKATGLVTTARITHATPASFIAGVPKRSMEDEIAGQILERGVDVALGGGAVFVTPELLAEYPGVVVVRTAEQLRAASSTPGRLVGVFTESHMAYELDRPETEPHLKEMAMTAVRRLADNPEGFVLQIEGARVDHGGHANDFPASLFDMIAFDETVAAVAEWASGRDDTLVIVTTDHGTGGPDLTVYGEASRRGLETLLGTTHTLSWILQRVRETPPDDQPARLGQLINEHCGVKLSGDEIDWALRPARGERVNGFSGATSVVSALGSVMANHFGVAYVSTNHTAERVEATALGPGADLLPTRIENYELHGLMTAALALSSG